MTFNWTWTKTDGAWGLDRHEAKSGAFTASVWTNEDGAVECAVNDNTTKTAYRKTGFNSVHAAMSEAEVLAEHIDAHRLVCGFTKEMMPVACGPYNEQDAHIASIAMRVCREFLGGR